MAHWMRTGVAGLAVGVCLLGSAGGQDLGAELVARYTPEHGISAFQIRDLDGVEGSERFAAFASQHLGAIAMRRGAYSEAAAHFSRVDADGAGDRDLSASALLHPRDRPARRAVGRDDPVSER